SNCLKAIENPAGVNRRAQADDDKLRKLGLKGVDARVIGIQLNRTAVAVRSRTNRLNIMVTAQVSQAGFNPAEAWRSGAGGLWSTLREGPNLSSWLSRGASGSLRNRRRLARRGRHQRSSAAASSCARRVRPGCW